ncbi:ABC transporter substrate-binding protein [Paenibacillus ginsengarvi]|uniref:Extracellular solute-binding protein n=1 Tax=Paenibacillus ginsengarvi TaxID=400777 RepID=A0A3B0BBC2_9BACL|nr:extracellular solute-binding protein [Paenibacillus ginsengarvi]RKN70655.1 extracellular solute-binding protein [Paenibacillus ginsengarvi]
MKRTWKQAATCLTVLTAAALAGACGANGTGTKASQSGTEPVQEAKAPAVDMTKPITLTFFNNASNEIFEQEIGARLKAKYPNVTIKTVGNGFTRSNMEKLLAAGEQIDLFWIGFQESIADMKELGLAMDLGELIKRDKYDLTRFDDSALQMVKDQADKGEIYALPWQVGSAVLFYNNDLFDKFGVAYPKDGMTWNETIELARKVTRSENGVQYRGLDIGLVRHFYQQYALSPYDPKTGKATYLSDPRWNKIMQFVKELYSIPGNRPDKIAEDRAGFMQQKVVAMLPWSAYFQPFLGATGLNFNIAALPVFDDAKGQGVSPAASILMMNPKTKYKDEGWEILKFLASDEVEIGNSRIGFPPAIKLQAAKDQFGADLPGFEKLNMKSVFYNKFTAQPVIKGEFHSAAIKPYVPMIQNVGGDKSDINTALREAQEAAEKAIEELKSR